MLDMCRAIQSIISRGDSDSVSICHDNPVAGVIVGVACRSGIGALEQCQLIVYVVAISR